MAKPGPAAVSQRPARPHTQGSSRLTSVKALGVHQTHREEQGLACELRAWLAWSLTL